jgi:DNA-directed RNA polymerase specialized sigma subunit
MKRRRAVRPESSGKETLDQRVPAFMPLVPVIAEQVRQQVVQPLDLGALTKDGFAGLIEAAKVYAAPSRVPFRVHVKQHIKGAILEGLQSRMGSWRPRSNSLAQRTGARGSQPLEAERSDVFLLSLLGLQHSTSQFDNSSERSAALAWSPSLNPPRENR